MIREKIMYFESGDSCNM